MNHKNFFKKILLLVAVSFFAFHFSFSQSANWTPVSPSVFPTNVSGQINGISRVSQLKFHPTNSSKLYAVSARGGLFVSTDGGNNWTLAPGCDPMPSNRFASVCVDFTNDQTIYLGTGDHNYYYNGTGVWKSTNGGITFTQTSLNNKMIVELIMDPNNNQVIVAATNSGIYKTTNGGTTWTLKSTARAFDDLKMKANTGTRTLYAATTDTGFFRSTDFGETWTQINSGITLPSGITNGGGCRIGVTPNDSNCIYFGMVTTGGIIYKSTNGGTSFSLVKTSGSPYLTYYTNSATDVGQGDYNFGIGVDRTNKNTVYLCAHAVWKSTDGGVTWTQLTDWWVKCHTDMHQIIMSPYNTAQVWDMNDGGVWLSTDGGNTWTPKSDGINGYEIYHGSCSPTRKDMYSIGTQDNGELYATSSGWFTNRGGDWQSTSSFDFRPNSSMVYYYKPDWGTVPVPKRRVVTGSDATYGYPGTTMSAIAFYRANPDLAFGATSDIYRTTNLTAATPTWTQISSFNKTIMAVHVHYGDPNRVYVITSDQLIYVTTNALAATPTWTSYALPNTTNNAANITSIKSQLNTIYITANTKAYKSIDNGATWTDITYNLPSVNQVDIIADEYYSSNQLVFVASNNAVYYKTGAATTWTIYSTNLPSRTSIVDMGIFNDSTSNTMLRVFTYGRGTWETPISNLRALTANFSANSTTPCTGQTVSFSDNSTGSVTSWTWSFPGGTPATSTSQNPTVTYNSAGIYSVTLTVSNGTTNSSLTRTNYISTLGNNLNVTENFEGGTFPSTNWSNVDVGNNSQAWTLYNGVGGFGTSNNCMYFYNYGWDAAGAHDELLTPKMNAQSYNSLTLTFDVAYQPYSLTSYIDSLQVLISTNCGNSFTPLYTKWGSSLATVTGTNTSSFVPTSAQWRTETINLNSYIGQSIIVSFRNIGRYGNNIFIDNINFNATVLANAGVDATICSGSSASIGMSAVNGINYSWLPTTGLSNSAISNPTASPTVTITYTLTATHASSGISATDNVVVTVNNLSVSGITVNENCFGGNNGTITLTVNPSSGNSYSWSNGATTQNISSLVAGNYSVTVTNSNTCVRTQSFSISQPANIAISLTPTNIPCFGTSTGSISSSTTGGTLPYSFHWSNGATTQNISSLAAGNYSLTVTDANGCTKVSSTSVNQSSAINVSLSGTNVLCNGASTGTVTSTVTGGTSPYLFLWSNGATTQNISSITANSYSVTVTDANSCSANNSISVTQPGSILLLLAPSAVNCFGASNGTIVTSASGGVSPYSFIWNTGATAQNLTSLTAGNYSVTITDANGCTKTSSTVVTQPSVLVVSLTAVNVSCNGASTGSVNSTTAGGTAPFSYLWSNGATSANISGVGANNYSITVNDSHGCVANSSISVTQPSAISISTSSSNVNCFGGNNGSISNSVSGGVSPYSYLWNNGATTLNLSSLAAGNYSLTVTDNNSCTKTVSVSITQPSLMSSSLITTAAYCGNSNGSISTTVSGGTSPYAFMWSNGATTQNISSLAIGNYSVSITDSKGCMNSNSSSISNGGSAPFVALNSSPATCGQSDGSVFTSVTGGTAPFIYQWNNGSTTQSLSNIPAGVYSLIVNDAVGCSGGSSITVSSSANVPAQPAFTASVNYVCKGQSGFIYTVGSVSGATSYLWSVSNGATISSGQGTNSVSIAFSSTATSSTITCSAVNSCGNGTPSSFSYTVVTAKPSAPTSITGNTSNCANTTGVFTVGTVVNATTYTWTVPANTSIISGQGTSTITLSFSSAWTSGSLKVNAGNCIGASTNYSKSLVSKPPIPGAITGPASVCANQTGVAYSIAPVLGATSYTWTVPASATIISGQGTTGIILNYGSGGGYVRVKASNTCGTSANRNLAITITCKVEKAENDSLIEIFPNPTEDYATLRFSSKNEKGILIEVTNVLGQKIISDEYMAYEGENNYPLNMTGFAKGTYIIYLKTEDEVIAKKLEVQ